MHLNKFSDDSYAYQNVRCNHMEKAQSEFRIVLTIKKWVPMVHKKNENWRKRGIVSYCLYNKSL